MYGMFINDHVTVEARKSMNVEIMMTGSSGSEIVWWGDVSATRGEFCRLNFNGKLTMQWCDNKFWVLFYGCACYIKKNGA